MTNSEVEKESLRQRNVPVQVKSEAEARETVLELNALEDKKDGRDGREKKMFGRTPDGTGTPLFSSTDTHSPMAETNCHS